MMRYLRMLTGLLLTISGTSFGQQAQSVPFRAIDLSIGEVQRVQLSDDKDVRVKLIELRETRDEVRSAVRDAVAVIEINGKRITVSCANYQLPVSVADVQIDCPVTKGYLNNSAGNPWALTKDARFRLWPANTPLLTPGSFVYPVKQRWFASDTQMANEPVFVDRGECPSTRKVYYHSGLDFGGAEGLVEVVATVDGLVVSAGDDVLPTHKHEPVNSRYDAIYLLDARNWYHRYSHLKKIEPSIRPGRRVKMGQTLGLLGKEGGSGGWSHLHYAISSLQPSGQWGTEEAYAFVWEAYRRQYAPELLAVARPHHLIWSGQSVKLEGRRSWSSSGKILRYDWAFTDGTIASGPLVEKVYGRPGTFSEILKITDSRNRTSYDFAVVQVMDKDHPDWCIPTIHAAFSPTTGIRSGDKVTFKVRTFGTTAGNELWDFGDGSPPVTVRSDGNMEPLNPNGYATIWHTYKQPGDYLVKVQRTDEHGFTATGRLLVHVGEDNG